MSNIRQASAIAINGRGVLIEGEPGSGKSSLALTLIDRGAMLIGDDGVALARKGEAIIASPPPNIAGKIEIRHVGIADLPTTSAPVALIILLAESAPRPVAMDETCEILDLAVPCVILPHSDPYLPLRAEWALKLAPPVSPL